MKKKTNNERNAGRKSKYTVTATKISVPDPILNQVEELSKPFLTPKKAKK